MNNKERCKAYYNDNRERILRERKDYAATHQEEIKARRNKYKESGRTNELAAQWRKDNREHIRKQDRESRRAIKYDVMSHYSVETEPICEMCLADGIRVSNINLLTIDHINGGGSQHRKEIGAGIRFYRWLKRNHYPEGYRVLCFGCNVCERRRGY